MRWFREGPSPFQTPLAMIGAKAGDRVLLLGASDGQLAGEVGRVTGLNGRTLVVDADSAAADRVQQGAARAGALVEFERAPIAMLPIDGGSFDIVVIHSQLAASNESLRKNVLAEAYRVLRDSGRLIDLEPGPRSGVLGLLTRRSTPVLHHDQVVTLLKDAGFRGVRLLADAEGIAYYEGRR